MGSGAVDRAFLHSRGYLKLLEIVFGAVTLALHIAEKDTRMTGERGEIHVRRYLYIVPIIMLVITGLLFLIFICGLADKLGGRGIWAKLDFYLGALLGFVLYLILAILAIGYCGSPKFDYSYHTNDTLIAGAVFACLTLLPYFIECCLLCRGYRTVVIVH